MKRQLKIALAVSTLVFTAQAMAEITFYEGQGFRGRAFTASNAVPNLNRTGFNDRISSIVVDKGRWEVCEQANFRGRCAVLSRGSYDTLSALGLNDAISSVRPAHNGRNHENEVAAPMATPDYAWRRRGNERTYEAPVTSVHAVMGPPTQHCWVEREQVTNRGDADVGGAVAGGVIGSNVGRNAQTGSQDVRRCENTTSGTPAYWDVTYNFHGQNHQMQMTTAPGNTVAVNRDGEPRL